jgi:hypothetical protein
VLPDGRVPDAVSMGESLALAKASGLGGDDTDTQLVYATVTDGTVMMYGVNDCCS